MKATKRLPGRSLRFVVIGLLLFIGYQLNILFADERLAPQSPQTQDTQAEQSKNQPGNRFGPLVTKNVSLKISPELAELFAGAPGDTQDLETMQSHLRRLVPQISRATVAIQLKDGMGSGVIISKDGYVLTAGHVVGRPDQQVTFILHDGRRLRGKTLGAHRGMHAGLMKDAGLMKIANQEDLPYAEMGQSRTLKQGQWCLALGHPGGYQTGRSPPLRLGRILLLNNEMLVSDCTLVGGDSGGPLFDAEKSSGFTVVLVKRSKQIYTYPSTLFANTGSDSFAVTSGAVPPLLGSLGQQRPIAHKSTRSFPGVLQQKLG